MRRHSRRGSAPPGTPRITWASGISATKACPSPERNGPVPPAGRGGFLDVWEAANALELTSHAYEGDVWDADGKPIHFSGQYRSDFTTERAQRFLRSVKSPFFLTLSYLEVHHQNDSDTFEPPKEYKGKYPNPFIPGDLRPLPGTWPSQWSDYLGCVAKMDETVGTIRRTLAETGLARNTILVFVSDHACHFKTRNAEYKRTPHESSIHIPLIIEGPGFNRGMQVSQLVSQVDLMPTLLEAAGLPIPSTVQGHSFLPLLDRRVDGWRDEVYFEMTEFTHRPRPAHAAVHVRGRRAQVARLEGGPVRGEVCGVHAVRQLCGPVSAGESGGPRAIPGGRRRICGNGCWRACKRPGTVRRRSSRAGFRTREDGGWGKRWRQSCHRLLPGNTYAFCDCACCMRACMSRVRCGTMPSRRSMTINWPR